MDATALTGDAELRFKAMARRNRMSGDSSAARRRLIGEATIDYACGLVTADLENPAMDGSLQMVAKDPAKAGISERQVTTGMNQLFELALDETESGKWLL